MLLFPKLEINKKKSNSFPCFRPQNRHESPVFPMRAVRPRRETPFCNMKRMGRCPISLDTGLGDHVPKGGVINEPEQEDVGAGPWSGGRP